MGGTISYSKTFIGCLNRMYIRQKRNSKKRGHNPPEYSKEEFINYCTNSEKFQQLYKQWVESGFERNLAPSIDRLDDYKGYTLKNIQVMVWHENNKKGWKDRKGGINTKNAKSVLKLDKNKNIIEEYYSIREASRQNNIKACNISSCCSGKTKTSGGFKWKYKL